MTLDLWPDVSHPVIGMLHAPPLPGAPEYSGGRAAVLDAVLRDAESLVCNGIHGLLLENFGDAPFYPGRVPRSVVAEMTVLALEVRRRYELPLGINVLRNDGQSALAIAAAVGAQFIRINILCGARLTDQGIINGKAFALLRCREASGAEAIRIWADVDVKHSAAIAPRPLEIEVTETIQRGKADAIVVSGPGTGFAPRTHELEVVRSAAGSTAVLVGSGASVSNIETWLPFVDGFIVGTSFKREGDPAQPVDGARVREFVDFLRAGGG